MLSEDKINDLFAKAMMEERTSISKSSWNGYDRRRDPVAVVNSNKKAQHPTEEHRASCRKFSMEPMRVL